MDLFWTIVVILLILWQQKLGRNDRLGEKLDDIVRESENVRFGVCVPHQRQAPGCRVHLL